MRRLMTDIAAGQPAPRPPGRSGFATRRAFTLIELMVAIGILVILTAMTVATLNVSFDSERIGSAARQVQSYLEGARDRAIYAKAPRGVRFLLDSVSSEDLNGNGILDAGEDINGNGVLDADNSTVSSMVFIGTVDDWSQGRILVSRPDFVNGNGAPVQDGVPDATDASILIGIEEDLDGDGILDAGEDTNWNGFLDTPTGWFDLKQLGLLQNGTKIKLQGNWYTVDTSLLDNTHELLRITPGFQDPSGQGVVVAEIQDGDYRLKLAPRVLPNQEPVRLPQGIVIDLDFSRLPATWQPGGFYSFQMDLLYSPQGTITGAAAAQGVIHFFLNDIVDTSRALGLDDRPGQANVDDDNNGNTDDPGETGWAGSDDLRPIDIDNNGNGQIDPEEQNQGDKLIVTLFTRTGHTATHTVFASEDVDGNGVLDIGEDLNGNDKIDSAFDLDNSDGVVDLRGQNMFHYAEIGEASQ